MPYIHVYDSGVGNLSDLSANAGGFETQRTNANDGMRFAQAQDSMQHRDDGLAFRYADALNRAGIAAGHDATRLATTGMRGDQRMEQIDAQQEGANFRNQNTVDSANGRSAAGIQSREGIATANRDQQADQFGRRMDFRGDQAAQDQERSDRNYDLKERESQRHGEEFRARLEAAREKQAGDLEKRQLREKRAAERAKIQQDAKLLTAKLQEAHWNHKKAKELLAAAMQNPGISSVSTILQGTMAKQKWESEIERIMQEQQKAQQRTQEIDNEDQVDAVRGGEDPQSGGYPPVQHGGQTYVPTGEMGPDGHPLYEAVV